MYITFGAGLPRSSLCSSSLCSWQCHILRIIHYVAASHGQARPSKQHTKCSYQNTQVGGDGIRQHRTTHGCPSSTPMFFAEAPPLPATHAYGFPTPPMVTTHGTMILPRFQCTRNLRTDLISAQLSTSGMRSTQACQRRQVGAFKQPGLLKWPEVYQKAAGKDRGQSCTHGQRRVV